MLVLESRDPATDRSDFERAGLRVHKPFAFEREATLPDGSVAKVGLALTFTSHPEIRNAGFFTCHQTNPEAFWKAEYQTHANGALRVGEVDLVAEEPRRYLPFIRGFTGSPTVCKGAGIERVMTPRGTIVIATATTCARRYGNVANIDRRDLPGFAGYKIDVEDLDRTRAVLKDENVPVIDDDEQIVVSPTYAHGVAIAFGAAAQSDGAAGQGAPI